MHLSFVPRRIALLAATAALILPLFSTSIALADDEDDTANVGVARISVLAGSVAVQRGDSSTASAAVVNAPVLAGDYLTTGDDSRAEVEINGGTAVRLGSGVQLRFTHLDNDARALQLAEGTVELRLMRGTDGTSDIDTPSISVRPRSSGSYRVTVTQDGQTLVTVRSGDAEVITPDGSQSLSAGSTLVAQGPASGPSITSEEAIALDEFDGFNQERDARFESAQAQSAYVDQDVTGVGDLDAYGRWVSDPTYGQVWTPTVVQADWAPYRDGRWVWEDGFGWTWVAAEPWGWAPYHYGSWFHSPEYGWAWYPPRPAAIVPVWRPALVAFFSFGGGGGSSFGVGYAGGGFGLSVGWVPLAPFEAYHPWWHPGWGTRTINNVTINNTYITNTTIVHNYRNAQFGVTSVSGERFTSGDFRHPNVVQASELRNVQAVRGAVPVVPTTANLRYSDTHVAPQLAVRPGFAGHGFAGAPAPVSRVPFEQQRAAISTATRIPITPATGTYRGGYGEGSHGDAAVAPSRPANDAWNRFGDNRGYATTPRANPVTAPAREGSGQFAAPTTPQQRGTYGQYQPPTTRTARPYDPARTEPANGYAPPRTTRSYGQSDGYGQASGYGRSYTPPARTYAPPGRTYSPPTRTYTPPTRTPSQRATAHHDKSDHHGE